MGRHASPETVAARVDARVPHPNKRLQKYIAESIRVNDDGCWIWTGAKNTNGLPIAHVGRDEEGRNVIVSVRRLMLEAIGHEPEDNERYGAECGRTDCVNPYHAYVRGIVMTGNARFMGDVRKYAAYRKKIDALTTKMKREGYTAEAIAKRYGTNPDVVRDAARKMLREK